MPVLLTGVALAVMGVAHAPAAAWPPRVSRTPLKTGPPTAADGALDQEAIQWYLSGIGPLEQLDSTAEICLSDAVRQLSRWEAARTELRAELGRAPSTYEWAAAVSAADAAAVAQALQLGGSSVGECPLVG